MHPVYTQENIDSLAYEISLLDDQKRELKQKIVQLALEGRSVRGTANKLKQVLERHHGLSWCMNDLINQRLKPEEYADAGISGR